MTRAKVKAPVLWVVLLTDECCAPPTIAVHTSNTRKKARTARAAIVKNTRALADALGVVRYLPAPSKPRVRGKRKRKHV